MNNQQTEIEQARRILKPSPVKQGKLPRWLKQRLRQARYESIRFLACDIVKNLGFDSGGCSWNDHDGVGEGEYEGDPKDCYISEPYHLSVEDVLVIKAICDRLQLRWYISSNSWHYPGKTIRVVICPTEYQP